MDVQYNVSHIHTINTLGADVKLSPSIECVCLQTIIMMAKAPCAVDGFDLPFCDAFWLKKKNKKKLNRQLWVRRAFWDVWLGSRDTVHQIQKLHFLVSVTWKWNRRSRKEIPGDRYYNISDKLLKLNSLDSVFILQFLLRIIRVHCVQL